METISSSPPIIQGNNIIVWLDFGPYAYINFGIATALSKINKFNFIGIVTTRQDIDFFQSQQILPFQKLIYYPDCYIGKYTFDSDALKKFEEKFDLNIWLNVYAERSFYKYWTEFHKFTKDEILSIVYHSITFFADVLETYKPKLVLTQQIGENISNLLLYQLAKKTGVKILMPNQVYLRNKIVIADNLISREISNEFEKLIPNSSNTSEIYDAEFIKNQDRSEAIDIILQGPNFKQTFLQKVNHYFKRLSTDPEQLYKNIGKTRLKMIKHRLRNHLEFKKRTQFLDTNSLKSIADEKFLYFPLSTEPEARILTTSPFYTNQITLIENIAKSLPINFLLYVKEHPVQKLKLWRPINDYKKIIAIPNVKFVHPSVNNQKLLSKCHGVLTISGGTGFEAIFYKKPVILFADEYYDVLSMVTKIKTLTTLPDDITNALSNFKFNSNELDVFMQAFNKQTLSVPYHSIMNDGDVLSSIQRNEGDSNLTTKEFQKFYEKYKSYFELMAQTVYPKL